MMSVTLQTLAVPEPELSLEQELFMRAGEGVSQQGQSLVFEDGAHADLCTWMNLLNLTNWTNQCLIETLSLELHGTGAFDVHLVNLDHKHEARTWQIKLKKPFLRKTKAKTSIDLADLLEPGMLGLWGVTITARGAARLDWGGFVTQTAEPRDVRLGIGITTFRREEAVQATDERLARFFAEDGAEIGRASHVYIIDNGQTLSLPETPGRTVVANRNLGGAGGFARALTAVQEGGYTHCLFMDDDASFAMENLVRTFALLRLARNDKAAVAGAMITQNRPWMMWEYGAVFERFCRPQFNGVHLHDMHHVAWMETEAARPKPKGFYGGWWYFAFPVAHVEHYPFPFFVRGDDISFSLAHEFEIATLNGVVSVQEDFGAKESPQTLYLDLRNHLHHHLSLPHMEIGRWHTMTLAARFITRSLLRMHYATAQAQCQSWEDTMTGIGYFAENADMADKRAEVARIGAPEAWQPADRPAPPEQHPPSLRYSHFMRLMLNGHLLPFWGMLGRKTNLDVSQRALLWPFWGVVETTVIEGDTTQKTPGRMYTVRHNKLAFFRIGFRMIRLSARWLIRYEALKENYRSGYGEFTTKSWWKTQF